GVGVLLPNAPPFSPHKSIHFPTQAKDNDDSNCSGSNSPTQSSGSNSNANSNVHLLRSLSHLSPCPSLDEATTPSDSSHSAAAIEMQFVASGGKVRPGLAQKLARKSKQIQVETSDSEASYSRGISPSRSSSHSHSHSRSGSRSRS